MQTYTSANTSINSTKVPAVFRRCVWAKGELNLDLGGGKYDTATEYLERMYGATNLVYDPYNRSLEHNNEVLAKAFAEGTDTCTISNVLNVIDEPDARWALLRLAAAALKDGGQVLIAVYEGDRSGKGRRTGKDQWQNNKPLRGYLQEVREVFPDAHIESGMIVAYK